MGMLIPGFLGLSIFIGGLILFYMFRKQYSEHIISSNILWEHVMNEWQATKWWKKLQRQLLLLLQILILLFIMLALTRPFFHTEGLEGDHVVLLLDSSASMATVIDGDGTTRFEKAKEEMLSLLEKRAREQSVSVISVGATPTLVVNQEMDKRLLEEAIGDLSMSYEHSEHQRALSLAKALSQQQSSSIYFFSDGITEADLKESQIDTVFHALNIEGVMDNNVSVMTFGVNTSGTQVSGIVTIRNESNEEKKVTLQFKADGELVHTLSVDIEAKEQGYVTVDALPHAVYYEAAIVEEDVYPLDNVAYSFSSSETKPALYLIGEINPFLHKVFLQLGHTIVQGERVEDIHEFARDSIIVISGVDPESLDNVLEISRPLLLLSAGGDEVLPLETSLEMKSSEELFHFVDAGDIYISQGRRQRLQNFGMVETIMMNGEIPLIQKGWESGLPYVQLLFDIQDSDWPLHPSFPIFVYNTLEFLKGESANLGYFTPNEQRTLQLDTEGMYSVMDEADTLITTFDRDTDVFKAPKKPGLYYLEDSEEQRKYFAVTLDDREKESIAAPSFSQQGENGISSTDAVRYEWWPWLLFIALLILFVEWEVYRRGIRA